MSRLVYIGPCSFFVFFLFLSGKMHFLFLGPLFLFWPLDAVSSSSLHRLASGKEKEEEEEEEEALTVGEEKEVLMRRVESGEGREDWATGEGFAK